MSYELPLVELLDSLSKEGIDTSQLNIVEKIEELGCEVMFFYDDNFNPLYDYALTMISEFPEFTFNYYIWQEWNKFINKRIWVLEIHMEDD